jgi:hypothetical protein
MDRRELMQLLSATASLAFLPRGLEVMAAGRALHGAATTGRFQALDAAQADRLSLIGDRILPRTDSPSASDVNATAFVDRLLAEWYPDEERARFLAGLEAIDSRARERHDRSFDQLDEPTQVALLTALDGESGELDSAAGAFGRLKGLVVYAYVTSERVQHEVMHSPVIPGRFDGCLSWPRQ